MRERTNEEWWKKLQGARPDEALSDLRVLLPRGLRFALVNHHVTEADLEDFVQDFPIRILREHSSFRGEARFTTWAQKVAVRLAFTELRRRKWRDLCLQDLLSDQEASDFTPTVLTDRSPDPAQVAMRRMMMDWLP